jgi:hypothetical protein
MQMKVSSEGKQGWYAPRFKAMEETNQKLKRHLHVLRLNHNPHKSNHTDIVIS